MVSPESARDVVVVLVIILIPLVLLAEPVDSAEIEGLQVAPKSIRADSMAAWSVDSGGGESSAGGFSLIASIGQPDAGLVAQGGTALFGGLWAAETNSALIFRDGFESGGTDQWTSAVAKISEEAP